MMNSHVIYSQEGSSQFELPIWSTSVESMEAVQLIKSRVQSLRPFLPLQTHCVVLLL